MKIYYYSGSRLPSPSANSVHVMKMCEAWGLAGHDVTLFAKGSAALKTYEFYGAQPCFKIAAAPDLKIPIIGGLLRLFYAAIHAALMGKPDLAYGRDAVGLFFLRGKETVFEAHQVLPARFKKIVVISSALKNDLQKKYPHTQFFVAPDGANIIKDVKPASLKGNNAMKIGYAGSLHAGKGLETITALATQTDYEFHVFGGDEAQTNQAQKLPNLFFYGHIPHAELSPYLAACDILIAPYSREARIRSGQDISRWISPMKIFEYMAARKPIICSDLPVLHEVLKDNENALLAEPENIQAWINAIKRLESDKDLRETLAENAFKNLEKNYSWARRAEKILSFCTGASS